MKKARVTRCLAAACLAICLHAPSLTSDTRASINGQYGGRLAISERAQPRTLNPVVAFDATSREIAGMFTADLIHINRSSLRTEPALASSWTVSADGRIYTLRLRRGVFFSDGYPFNADDVAFTFQVYLDERVRAPQRDLLLIAGKPIQVEKVDAYTVIFKLAAPYAAVERLFDSIAILPRHLLLDAYNKGNLPQAWGLNTSPKEIASLGPFRFKEYVPGQHLTLDRNPYYWKKDPSGDRLPYLDEVTAVFSGDADAEAMRFQVGEIDVVNRLSAASFAALAPHQQQGNFRLYDLGPGLEYNFLFFNLNKLDSRNLARVTAKQEWFRQRAFRQAVERSIDREAIARLAYRGHACPLWGPVTPANKLWINNAIPKRARSTSEARELLARAGFSWSNDGRLQDARSEPVVFSILFNAANVQQVETATLIQDDLRQVGMDVKLVPMEFHAYMDRIFNSLDYEAAIMSLASGDADPNSDVNVWASGGGTHVWDLAPKKARADWQKEIDFLMSEQMVTLDYQRRKGMYDRVQQLIWENVPVIFLVSPNVLVGATNKLGDFRPAILSNYSLWNVEELFLRAAGTPNGR
jgi:peptide/nickel transport system substrate-binding protein